MVGKDILEEVASQFGRTQDEWWGWGGAGAWGPVLRPKNQPGPGLGSSRAPSHAAEALCVLPPPKREDVEAQEA